MRRMQIMIGLLLLTVATMAYAADSARYVVTLNENVSPAAIEQLAIRYGGRVDPLSSGSTRQFAVTMTPSGAQLLGSDARVTAVVPESSAASLSGRLHPASETYGSDGNSGAYSYDGSGNITGIGADSFLYDAEGRLVRATVRGVQEDYVYDAFGNRTSATGATNCLGTSPCATSVSVSPSTNHLTSGVSYDDAGSVTAANGAAYTYDGTGMMTRSIAGSDDRQYVYTADDERIAVRQGFSWTWSVRDFGGKVLREYTSAEGSSLSQSNRQWIKDYVWRDGLLLASTDATGTYHYHLDHIGTPRLITDANHVRVAEHAYYPFGAEMSIIPHEFTEELMKFTGHERDIVAGGYLTLDYMHARYYGGAVGRFLSVDRSLGNLLRPQSWNRYAYVLNSPVNYFDPYGLKERQPGQQMEKGDTCNGTVVDGWCTGETITVEAPDPQITPVQLGWEWLTGTGPSVRTFNDNDRMTEMLKEHSHVLQVAKEVCNGSRSPEGSAPYNLSGLAGVPKYLRDYSTLATGGLTGNLAVTYLGSYQLSYVASGGAVTMHVKNSSSAASALRPPVLGYTQAWQQNVGSRIDHFFASGPMSQTTQEFNFSVPCQ
jgi:RHS repeat-associated protein